MLHCMYTFAVLRTTQQVDTCLEHVGCSQGDLQEVPSRSGFNSRDCVPPLPSRHEMVVRSILTLHGDERRRLLHSSRAAQVIAPASTVHCYSMTLITLNSLRASVSGPTVPPPPPSFIVGKERAHYWGNKNYYYCSTSPEPSANSPSLLSAYEQFSVPFLSCHPDDGGATILRNVGSYNSHTA
jgi:hypothetical protein